MASKPESIQNDWVEVPTEPTDEMVDSVRTLLMALETPGRQADFVRRHIEACGDTLDGWPEWAITHKGHLTKSAVADIIYRVMIHHGKRQKV